jgi:hypothetical protein
MALEMSSLRAQREGGRVSVEHSLQRLDMAGTKNHLCEIQAVLQNKCVACLLGGDDADHSAMECKGLSKGWLYRDSVFKTWRSSLRFPPKHCFHCGMPQVSFMPLEARYCC